MFYTVVLVGSIRIEQRRKRQEKHMIVLGIYIRNEI